MKMVIYLVGMLVISMLLIPGCENENNKQLTLSGMLINNSACKSSGKSTMETLNTPDTLSCIDYSFDDFKNRLTINHINSAFNCCPESLYCKVTLSNDTIIISEHEAKAQCNCNCLFDLDLVINGVDTKEYQIKFIEPYSGEQKKICFKIDLKKEKNGSFCVTRKSYPWGMQILN
jgi:hypothetical protein